MHIKRLPLDTLITGIGRLFKYDDKPWFINLWGESEESKAKYHTSFSHMHLLAKRACPKFCVSTCLIYPVKEH